MAILEILQHPDIRLSYQATRVEQINDKVRLLVANMLETNYANNAIGLAATQVNVTKQVMVVDISEQHNEPRAFINPEIIAYRGREQFSEGCLSVPGYWIEVERHAWIKIKALDVQGKEFILEAEGLLCDCIQHEMDHLQGLHRRLYIHSVIHYVIHYVIHSVIHSVIHYVIHLSGPA